MEEEAYEDFVLAPKANQPSVHVTLVLDRIFAKIVDMDIHGAATHFVPGSMMVGLWQRIDTLALQGEAQQEIP